MNTSYGDNIEIGIQKVDTSKKIAIVGWNNKVPSGTKLGEGVTVSPSLAPEKWVEQVEAGRVLR